jgi:hypothetical protein
MQELQDKIHILGQTIASGDLDEMIRRKPSKTIDDILDDLLRSTRLSASRARKR